MSIQPIGFYDLLSQGTAAQPGKQVNLPFEEMFRQAAQEIESAQQQKEQLAMGLALGDIDDLAQVNIASAKADLALQTMIEMRNKVLDAYTEIMRMSI